MDSMEVVAGIRRIIRSINLESKRIDKEFGLSLPQYLCMTFIEQQDDKRAQTKDLKNFLNLNASTVSGIVSRLQKKNLVKKIPHASDKRGSYIVLTSKGNKLIHNAPQTVQERLSEKLDNLPPDKVKEIIDVVNMLADYMQIGELDAASVLTLDVPISGTE